MGHYDRTVETDRKKLKEAWDLNKDNFQRHYKNFEDYVEVSKRAHILLELCKDKITEQEIRKLSRGGEVA